MTLSEIIQLRSHFDRLNRLRDRLVQMGCPQDPSSGLAVSVTMPGWRENARTVVIGNLIHGNEYGTLDAVVPWLEGALLNGRELGRFFPSGLKVFCANPEAGLEQRRFLDDDLNRLFGLRPEGASGHEWERVEWLKRLLFADDVALFIDLHQTIEPCEAPFFIFGYHQPSLRWAEQLSSRFASRLVTRAPGSSFATGLLSGDEALRQKGIPALTIEFGQKGYSNENTRRVMAFLHRLEEIMQSPSMMEDVAQAPCLSLNEGDQSPLELFQVTERIIFDGPTSRLREGIANFSRLSAGEEIGFRHDGSVIICPRDSFALFPKYPKRDESGRTIESRPSDLINLVEKLPKDTLREWDRRV